MSGKITDARMDQLREHREKRDALKKQIEKEKEEMQEILDRMDAVTQKSISSSAATARKNRGKDISGLSLQDEVDAKQMSIERLEELYADAVQELEELEQMVGGK